MSFQWPQISVVAALLMPLLLIVYVWSRRRRRPASRYSSLALVRAAGGNGPSRVRHLPIALLSAAGIALAFSIARPMMDVAVPSNRSTIILVLDVSSTMCATDVAPTRLAAAQAAAAAFIDGQPEDTQIGIVAFSSFAAVVQAPTRDKDLLNRALANLSVGRGTAIGSGILAAMDAIARTNGSVAPVASNAPGSSSDPAAGAGSRRASTDIVVLLTDGANNAGSDPLEAADEAADRGIPVYTIGFGTASGGSNGCTGGGGGLTPRNFGGGQDGVDEALLSTIAERTGATYAPARSAGELAAVFSDLPTTLVINYETTELTFVFVVLGMILSAAALLAGRRWQPLP